MSECNCNGKCERCTCLESKINEYELKNVLIVDDTKENIDAAKKYFENEVKPLGVEFDYASSAKEAIEKIDEKNYDLIFSDLVMETPKAGMDVVEKGLEKAIYTVIFTGEDHGSHGYTTQIIPEMGHVDDKKNNPETWKEGFSKVLNSKYAVFRAINRFRKYSEKKSLSELKEVIEKLYDFHFKTNYGR